MHNFIVFSTPPEGQNGVYRTFLDFVKTKALQVENFTTDVGFSIFTDSGS